MVTTRLRVVASIWMDGCLAFHLMSTSAVFVGESWRDAVTGKTVVSDDGHGRLEDLRARLGRSAGCVKAREGIMVLSWPARQWTGTRKECH